MVAPFALAHTFVAPYQAGGDWKNNGGYPPCSGSNSWNLNGATPSNGHYSMYAQTQSTANIGCTSNSAQKTLWAGLHGGYWSPATGQTTTKLSYSITVYSSQYVSCASGSSASAQIYFFAAVWDVGNNVNLWGNTYYYPSALDLVASCPTSGTTSVICGVTYTYTSGTIYVSSSDSYQPRVAVEADTNTNPAYLTSATATNDLQNSNPSCPGTPTNDAILNYIDFQ